MLRDLRYLFAYTLPLSAFAALYLQGFWSYTALIYAFGIIPLLDYFAPQAKANNNGEETESRNSVRFFDWLLYANVPIFYGLLAFLFFTVSTTSLETYELVGLILSTGVIAGTLGINVAHELGHRTSRGEQVLAKALLLPCLYLHFFIEHNRGHHKHVATPHDPATSRFGESIYAFWPRTVVGSYLNAWALEKERLGREDRSPFSLSNHMVQFTLLQLSYLGAIGIVFSPWVMCIAIAVAVFGFLLLEAVNYIEHYGLVRRQLASGRYEAVSPQHSWNSEHELGRIVLYELTRHADHHFKSTRPYQSLRYLEESPNLPAGYPASILMSLVPPLWFSVMNPKVREFNEQRQVA
ncbi:MAG: alkane 1-monooxygenase [Saprospiraceae bacterium]